MSVKYVVIGLVLLGGLVVAGAVARKRQVARKAGPDVNAEMPRLANDAVTWGRDKGVELDFTPGSVERVEGLLGALHEKRKAGQLPDDQVNKAAVRYGAYVGEVIRRMHGGSWAIDHAVAGPGSFPIRWGANESFPIGWCGKRIVNGEEDNVWFKFRVLLLGEGKGGVTFMPGGGEVREGE